MVPKQSSIKVVNGVLTPYMSTRSVRAHFFCCCFGLRKKRRLKVFSLDYGLRREARVEVFTSDHGLMGLPVAITKSNNNKVRLDFTNRAFGLTEGSDMELNPLEEQKIETGIETKSSSLELPDPEFTEWLEQLKTAFSELQQKDQGLVNGLLQNLPEAQVVPLRNYIIKKEKRMVSLGLKYLKKSMAALKSENIKLTNKLDKARATQSNTKGRKGSKADTMYIDHSFFILVYAEPNRYRLRIAELRKVIPLGVEIATIVELLSKEVYQKQEYLDLGLQQLNLLKGDVIVIIEKLWSCTSDHPYYLGIQDKTEIIYQCNQGQLKNAVSPYSIVSLGEFRAAISFWLKGLFNQCPPGFLNSALFINTIQRQLSLNVLPIDNTFLTKYKHGIALTNGYFYLDNVSYLLRFQKHSPLIVFDHITEGSLNPCEIMPCDRLALAEASSHTTYPLVSKTSAITSAELISEVERTAVYHSKINQTELNSSFKDIETYWESQEFMVFLTNLCEGNPLNSYLIRTLLQRVILAEKEGELYKTCHWLHGSSDTAQFVVINLITLLAGFACADMNISQNPFLVNSRTLKKAIIVFQVSELNLQSNNHLSSLLKKDTLALNFDSSPSTVNSKTCRFFHMGCQVIFTSDKILPENSFFYKDSLLRDKIIYIQFSKDIPSYLRTDSK